MWQTAARPPKGQKSGSPSPHQQILRGLCCCNARVRNSWLRGLGEPPGSNKAAPPDAPAARKTSKKKKEKKTKHPQKQRNLHSALERRERAKPSSMGGLLPPGTWLGAPGLMLQSGRLAGCPPAHPAPRVAEGHARPLSLHAPRLGDTPGQRQRGPNGSRPGFLGDCCQVRNSEAEFIILADKRRCSSPGLLPDPVPAPRCAGRPSDTGDGGVSESGLCLGSRGCAAPGISTRKAALVLGLFLPAGEWQEREGGKNQRDRGEAQTDAGWWAALPRLP